MYSRFLDFIDDNQLDEHELKDFSKWATRIALTASADTAEHVSVFVEQCTVLKKFRYADLTEEEVVRWKTFMSEMYQQTVHDEADFITIGRITSDLREDLGEVRLSERRDTLASRNMVDRLVNRIGRN